MIREYLPIGSVVLLKGGTKPIMIFGVKQLEEGNNETFDYGGVLYPEGNIGSNFTYFFNHENIDKVLFKGYESKEFFNFIDMLAKAYNE